MNINYDKLMQEEIENFNGRKPKLLLHSCCGPCSSYVITYLKDYFDITVLYYNPNFKTTFSKSSPILTPCIPISSGLPR